ncbi:MAG: hypothetical protein ACI8S6_001258 [Myxococcota bacterium]|jgi:hypothetical protein
MWWLTLGAALAQSTDPDPYLAADLGFGGAIRANPGAYGAAITAPAIIALSPRYSVGGGGRIGSSKVRRVDAGAIDSTTGPVALGAVFIRESLERDATVGELPGWLEDSSDLLNPQVHTSFGGGLAASFLNRRLAVGAGARYWAYTSRFVDSASDIQAFASVAGRLSRGVYLSVGGENLLPTGWDLAQPTISTAARWEESGIFALEADLITQLGDEAGLSALHTGIEGWVSEFVPLRFGYQRDYKDPSHTITAGFGAGSEQAILEYGASLQLGSLEHAHSLSMRVFL